MPNVFSKILNLFKYTRPMNNEGGFELLEDKYEIDRTEKVDSSEYEKDQKQNEQKDKNQNKVSQIIKPVKVKENINMPLTIVVGSDKLGDGDDASDSSL